jgi:thermitase
MFQPPGLVPTASAADLNQEMVRRIAALTALAAALAVPPAAQAAGTVELIVRRDAGLSAAERADVRADAGVQYERRLRLADTELVTVPGADSAEALAELDRDPDVRWAMRNGTVRATAVTTDPGWSSLWGLPAMKVPEAWSLATGTGVAVAVTDTGAQFDHPDLAGQFRTNPGEMGAGKDANGLDDDGNGLVDDWRGWDFVNGDNDPADDEGHGTHVTGTIVARNGNGVGITGAAPDARVLPLKVLDSTGEGSWAAVADAFDLAGDMGIRIVNASLGGFGSVPVVDAVARDHPNTLYVAAAGNDGVDLDGYTFSPCEAVASNVLCVGASDEYDARAYFSNYGSTAVDVFAPGVDILSTWPSGYAYADGTSMATPNTAAVAALVLSRTPSLTTADLKAAIMSTVDAGSGLESVSGGRVDAVAALADRDGDGVENADDKCPSRPGPASDHGCPLDTDHDGVLNDVDACPAAAGPAYLSGCPAPSRPVTDRDADGVPDSKDACPDGYGPGSPFGCPPDPLRISSVKVGGRAGRVTVTVNATRAATLRVTAQRRACRRAHCSWRTVRTARAAGARATVKLGLKAGRYRLKVAVSDAGERATRTKTIAVRR